MVTIYALKDPATGEVRYVGKANNLKARIRAHLWEAKSSTLQNRKVRWLRSLDSDPVVEILEIVPNSIWEARERFWIAKYRSKGARLTNFAPGGQTSPVEGRGHTEETKAKCRAAAIRNGAVPPSRLSATAWNKGTKGVSKPNSGSLQKGCAAWNKGFRKTHCVNNHELTTENRYYSGGRYRGCRVCISEASKRHSRHQKDCRTEEVGQ